MPIRPWTGRNVGIEMEMTTTTTSRTSVSEGMLRRAIEPHTLRLNSRNAGYWRSDGSAWDIKTDSSCGWEVASPAIQLDESGNNAELRGVCEGISSLRPVVNRSCGLHVHVEVQDFGWQELQMLMALWARYEPFFYELMPVSRRSNTYCHPLNRIAWDAPGGVYFPTTRQVLAADTERSFDTRARSLGRYASLNTSGWWRHKRVEFRLHSGTVNYTKIRHWTMLCCALVGRVIHPDLPPVSRSIREAGRASGFSTVYIGRQLGLLPSRQVPEPPPEGLALMAWLNARRLQFTPQSANYDAPAPAAGTTPATTR